MTSTKQEPPEMCSCCISVVTKQAIFSDIALAYTPALKTEDHSYQTRGRERHQLMSDLQICILKRNHQKPKGEPRVTVPFAASPTFPFQFCGAQTERPRYSEHRGDTGHKVRVQACEVNLHLVIEAVCLSPKGLKP